MKTRDRRPWTEAEDNILRDYYASKKNTIDEVCQMLGRKKRMVQERIKVLSLHTRPCKIWRDEEIKFLQENYPTMGWEYCSKQLGRSKDSIYQKVSELSIEYLSLAKKLDKEKKNIIEDYNSGMKLKEIAKKYESTDYSILSLLRRYNIQKTGHKNKHVRKESIHWNGFMDISGTYWGGLKKSAKERGFEFSINIKYAWDVFIAQEEKCALSGVPIGFNKQSQLFKSLQTASLDRIDSSKGYIEGNIQWLHKTVNRMKWDLSEDDFIYFCRKITENKADKV